MPADLSPRSRVEWQTRRRESTEVRRLSRVGTKTLPKPRSPPSSAVKNSPQPTNTKQSHKRCSSWCLDGLAYCGRVVEALLHCSLPSHTGSAFTHSYLFHNSVPAGGSIYNARRRLSGFTCLINLRTTY